ncbi:MAG: hypothetical protein HW388_1066 [Dehalococcoidia bacterium]|nr:hypothetical protein [Dehalococcoidia bacterium]
MNHRRNGIHTLGLLAILVLLALLLFSSVAQGAGPEPGLTLQAPAQGTLGQTATVQSTLLALGGSPVSGATIQFFSPASFLSTSGEVFLGEAVTDSSGVAVLRYELRSDNQVEIIARFAGNASYGPAESSATIAVQGSTQLYQEDIGVRVPGLNVWLLAAILGGVWSVYFTVFVLVSRIAREGVRARAI